MDNSFRLHPHSNRFDEADDAWLTQRDELVNALTDNGVPMSREPGATTGDKGAVDTILLAAISAGGLKTCAEVWRAWLGRDRTRWIALTRTTNGVEESFVIRGRDIDDGQFDGLVADLADKLGTSE